MKCSTRFAAQINLPVWLLALAFSPVLGAPDPQTAPSTAPMPTSSQSAAAEEPFSIVGVLKTLESGDSEPFVDLEFDSLVEFHKAEGDKTYVSISIAFHPDQLESTGGGAIQPFARLSAMNAEALRYEFTEAQDFADSFTANTSGLKIYQTGYALPPGRYRLSTGAWSPNKELVGGRTQIIVVPAFAAGALELSSVTLAAALERATDTNPTVKQPFIWGSFKVVPHVEKSFPRQDPLRLYYQIYNAAADPETGRPKLGITYTFFRKMNDMFQQAAPPQTLPEQESQVALYELPLNGWPAGDFKVRIDVQDAVTQTSVTEEILFKLR
ncbi:MAG: hypothetical protein O7F16_10765 [Acidobacteria bacterium]|nr:hypothetical protein [Acidobacteriota bacterium]